MENTGKPRIKREAYKPASWRCTLPVDPNGEKIGVGLNLENGEVARYELDIESAVDLAESILDYVQAYRSKKSHSDRSSGMPNQDAPAPYRGGGVCGVGYQDVY